MAQSIEQAEVVCTTCVGAGLGVGRIPRERGGAAGERKPPPAVHSAPSIPSPGLVGSGVAAEYLNATEHRIYVLAF